MCLHRILTEKKFIKKYPFTFYDKKIQTVKVGWKVMYIKNKKVLTANSNFRTIPFKISRWIKEYDYRASLYKSHKTINIENSWLPAKRYKIGFHVFQSIDDAKTYCQLYRYSKDCKIFKVYFVDECAYGLQDDMPVIITKSIYIPRQNPYCLRGKKSVVRI